MNFREHAIYVICRLRGPYTKNRARSRPRESLIKAGLPSIRAEPYNPEASNFPLEPCWDFLAGVAVQLKARKIGKYGIREFKAKNFELVTLIHICLRPKEIVSWHKR